MHFHLPKPLHGWRQFAGEVGIIVIGVLIALGAEQVVGTIHARAEANAAERRIRSELIDVTALEVERVAVDPCQRQRMRELATGVAAGRSDWSSALFRERNDKPMALRELYRMPIRNWVTDAYREALAHGDLASLPAEKRSKLADLYKQIDHLAQLNDQEQLLKTQLAPLQFNPQLDSSKRYSVLADIARLDAINELMVLISRQGFKAMHDLGFSPTREDLARSRNNDLWKEELKGYRSATGFYATCVDRKAASEFAPELATGVQ